LACAALCFSRRNSFTPSCGRLALSSS